MSEQPVEWHTGRDLLEACRSEGEAVAARAALRTGLVLGDVEQVAVESGVMAGVIATLRILAERRMLVPEGDGPPPPEGVPWG